MRAGRTLPEDALPQRLNPRDGWRLPRAVDDRWVVLLRPVHAQHGDEIALWRGQPVRFEILARRFVLEVQRQRTVRTVFRIVAQADREPVQGVRNEPPALVDLIHSDRPEAVDGRRETLREDECVAVRAREFPPARSEE